LPLEILERCRAGFAADQGKDTVAAVDAELRDKFQLADSNSVKLSMGELKETYSDAPCCAGDNVGGHFENLGEEWGEIVRRGTVGCADSGLDPL
jgi:hypothetical protein